MVNLKFENLPEVVGRLYAKIEDIEKILLQKLENQDDETPDQKFNVPEASDFLEIAISTLYSKVSKGELPACKAPGSKRLFFFKSDLISCLKEGRRKTNSEIAAAAHEYLINKRGGKHG